MATPKPALIMAIRKAAKKIAKSSQYQWGHMGSCNCGHLVQEVTQLSRSDIHGYAMRTRGGDWSEQAMDFCPTSGYLMDQVISIMLGAGMELVDFKHLERLSDKRVLARLPEHKRHLRHNYREDVVTYMNAWADLLEEQLVYEIEIPEVDSFAVVVAQ